LLFVKGLKRPFFNKNTGELLASPESLKLQGFSAPRTDFWAEKGRLVPLFSLTSWLEKAASCEAGEPVV
jgi:hypothetical protein